MFGLRVTESHDGYIGWRAIFTRGYVDIVPNRGSSHGNEESIQRLLKWANTPRKLPPPPKKKRPRKVTPWKQLLEDTPNELSTSETKTWEVSEGNFVLRANPCSSYGYLYVALFERTEEPAEVPTPEPV